MSLELKRARKKERLDRLLVERNLVESRERAQRLIMAGEVLVDEVPVSKPGRPIPLDATIRIRTPLPYVSRGGLKLAAALDAFALDVTDQVAIDVGASTGGFTDCLLQRGAKKVYAIDVGYGQLAWSLRNDNRVVTIERTNIRYLDHLPADKANIVPLATLAVIDTSFISLKLVLPAALRLLTKDAEIVALIKPQFEAGKDRVGKGGVVRDRRVHRNVLVDICHEAKTLGLTISGLAASPVIGPAGNIEFLIWLKRIQSASEEPPTAMIERALQEAASISKT